MGFSFYRERNASTRENHVLAEKRIPVQNRHSPYPGNDQGVRTHLLLIIKHELSSCSWHGFERYFRNRFIFVHDKSIKSSRRIHLFPIYGKVTKSRKCMGFSRRRFFSVNSFFLKMKAYSYHLRKNMSAKEIITQI